MGCNGRSRIVVTGAGGLIGQKISDHLESKGHEVVRLAMTPREGVPLVLADLSEWDEAWVRHLAGADCVINLAACPRPDADWALIQKLNLDLAANVYEAAARQQVRRVVFASSNWVMAGHRGTGEVLRSDTIPYPINAYGMSKLAGERLGRMYARTRGLSVISLRIGFNQRRPGNEPGDHMSGGLWGQRMWLSDADLCNGFACAVEAPDSVDHAVLNLVSDNEGMQWDLSEARELIGYVPQDGHAPVVTAEMVQRETLAREIIDAVSANLARLQAEKL